MIGGMPNETKNAYTAGICSESRLNFGKYTRLLPSKSTPVGGKMCTNGIHAIEYKIHMQIKKKLAPSDAAIIAVQYSFAFGVFRKGLIK
jgi:hypothetical protein